jgi:hypothetical protein
MIKKILIAAALLVCCHTHAQDTANTSIAVSGYAEIYYAYDFNKPSNNDRPGFIYSHNRHNEYNLNLGFIKAAYAAGNMRANIALAAGTYINVNYAAEPGGLKNIYEANVGIKISKTKDLWIDAGIMPSHIGFESAVSKDCWTLTRSILADNSPYYEAGARLTYTTNDGKWLLSIMALNGWQRIQRVDGNSFVSWGTQVQYKPSGKVLINYSTFIGTNQPDSTRRLRIFHNLYGIVNINSKTGITAGFDIGTEAKSGDKRGFYTWYSPVLVIKQALTKHWAIAARVEYYCDKNGVIIATGTANGFRTMGWSVNMDYAPSKNIVARIEGRTFSSKDAVFIKTTGAGHTNSFVTASVGVSF